MIVKVKGVDFYKLTLRPMDVSVYVNTKWVSDSVSVQGVGSELSFPQSEKLLVKEENVSVEKFVGDEDDAYEIFVKAVNEGDLKLCLGFIAWFRGYRTYSRGDTVLVCDCFGNKSYLDMTVVEFLEVLGEI